MKIIFFGTGTFGIPTLRKIIESGHELLAVVTQPDRKKDRGFNVWPPPVKEFLEHTDYKIEIAQPEDIKSTSFSDFLEGQKADVFVVVDYGRLLKKDVLDLAVKMSINLHPSLLPKYRGAAPVNWAILNGEKETGNSVIKMTEKMDAGDIILQKKNPIEGDENALDLSNRLSEEGADLVLEALDLIEKDKAKPVRQDESAASFAPKLEKQQGLIDWEKPALEISRMVRGLQPWPGAFTYENGTMLKILKAEVVENTEASGPPGSLFDGKKLIVNTGEGILHIKEVQMEGKRAMESEELTRGRKIPGGTILGKAE